MQRILCIVFVVGLSASARAGSGQTREVEDQSFMWAGAEMGRLLPSLVDIGRLTDFFLKMKKDLELSPAQVHELAVIEADQSELVSRYSLEFRLAVYKLNEVLARPIIDMKAVESVLRQKEKVRADLDIHTMRNTLRALEVLNHAQHLRALRAVRASIRVEASE